MMMGLCESLELLSSFLGVLWWARFVFPASNDYISFFVVCLQEKKRNNLKDFLNVAGPMGVTHFLILSKTDTAPYLRVARTPQGPTLTFKIHEYSLAVDVAQSQLRPRCPQDLFKNPPLVFFFSDTDIFSLLLLFIYCFILYSKLKNLFTINWPAV